MIVLYKTSISSMCCIFFNTLHMLFLKIFNETLVFQYILNYTHLT